MEFSKAVTFSFDDGVTQDIRLINLLNKYNLKATFNLNSELLGRRDLGYWRDRITSSYKIEKEDVREVYKGHEIAVHTLTHPNLTALPDDEIIYQVEKDRLNLSEIAGYEVIGMAYPGGGVNNNGHVAEVIKENTKVKYARTTTNTDSFKIQEDLFRLNPNSHFLDFERLNDLAQTFIALTPSKPQIFYIWGHSYELDWDTSFAQKLEEFFKFISNRKDIFYGTNKEVLL